MLLTHHLTNQVESIRFRSIGTGNPKITKKAAAITKDLHPLRQSCNAYVVFKVPFSFSLSSPTVFILLFCFFFLFPLSFRPKKELTRL